jgi:crossover junction endodeoxyribonuclease RuvC
MIIAGIDPGITGALALTDGEGYLKIYPVPVVGGQPDYVAWAQQWQGPLKLAGHVWIEKVAAMPKQGVSSTFTFGERYGFILGLVAASGSPFSHVRPQEWKKRVGLVVKADKAASRIRASELFPAHTENWKLAKDDGKAEAALIAHYGQMVTERF